MGLVGACLAEVGNRVLCLDVDPAKIALLQGGGVLDYEPGLEDMIRRNAAAGRLSFTTDVAAAARFGEIQFIAVGTPPDEDGSADLQYVLAAARGIARHIRRPPWWWTNHRAGGHRRPRARRHGRHPGRTRRRHRFSVVSNQEFLKEGAAIDDFMRPDRIVVGWTTPMPPN